MDNVTVIILASSLGLPLLVFAIPILWGSRKSLGIRFTIAVLLVWYAMHALVKYVTWPANIAGQEQLRRLQKEGLQMITPDLFGWVPGVIGAAVALPIYRFIHSALKQCRTPDPAKTPPASAP